MKEILSPQAQRGKGRREGREEKLRAFRKNLTVSHRPFAQYHSGAIGSQIQLDPQGKIWNEMGGAKQSLGGDHHLEQVPLNEVQGKSNKEESRACCITSKIVWRKEQALIVVKQLTMVRRNHDSNVMIA